MKKLKFLLVAILAIATSQAHAQTVDEVIGKYIDAIGGKAKLSQVKSVYYESTGEAMGGSAPVKEHLMEGKGYKTELEFNGMNIVSCFTDKGGWTTTPRTTQAETMPDDLYKSGKIQLYLTLGLLDYAAKGYKAELVGKEGDAYKIKLSEGTSEIFHFIDSKTWLLTKTILKGEMMGQSVEVTTTYSDHKKTDFGITLPYKKSIDMGMLQLTQKVDKVEVNKKIDPKIFEMPK